MVTPIRMAVAKAMETAAKGPAMVAIMAGAKAVITAMDTIEKKRSLMARLRFSHAIFAWAMMCKCYLHAWARLSIIKVWRERSENDDS